MLSKAQARDTSTAIERWNTNSTTISSFATTHTTRKRNTRNTRSLERGAWSSDHDYDRSPQGRRQAQREVAARVAERKMSVDGGSHSP